MMNIWISYTWTADEETNAEKIDHHNDNKLTMMIFSACIYAFMYSNQTQIY